MTILKAICSAYKAFKATMNGETEITASYDVNHYPSLVGLNKQLQDENAELARKLELAKKVAEDSNSADTQSAIKAAKASVYCYISNLLQAEKIKFIV